MGVHFFQTGKFLQQDLYICDCGSEGFSCGISLCGINVIYCETGKAENTGNFVLSECGNLVYICSVPSCYIYSYSRNVLEGHHIK